MAACEQDQDETSSSAVKNSWLWTEELSETCRLAIQK